MGAIASWLGDLGPFRNLTEGYAVKRRKMEFDKWPSVLSWAVQAGNEGSVDLPALPLAMPWSKGLPA